MAGSPEVVEHVFEAIEVHDALDQTSGSCTLNDATDICVFDVKDGVHTGGWTGLERIF
jgi:hypothetical protein